MALTDIPGIGGNRANDINNAGIDSIEELSKAKPSDLPYKETTAMKYIRKAKQEVITSKTGSDLLEEFENQSFVSTGVSELDDIMGGGWEPETVSLIYGSSGTGKTQVLFSTMGEAASEGTVVYLMTEVQSKSIADRLRRLSEHANDLDNIHIYEAYNVEDQQQAYHKIDENHDEIDLMVVDSFTAQFRMTDRFDGRANMGERSAVMGSHLRKLSEMARVYQMPIVMTGQVYHSPEMYGETDIPWGGEKLYHFISYFLYMTDGDGDLKRAELENHPGMDEDDIQLMIGDDHIEARDP